MFHPRYLWSRHQLCTHDTYILPALPMASWLCSLAVTLLLFSLCSLSSHQRWSHQAEVWRGGIIYLCSNLNYFLENPGNLYKIPLIRRNFRAKIGNFCAYLFSRTFRFRGFKNLIYANIKEKQRFCENLSRIYFHLRKCRNSVLIFAQFRANSGFVRKCAKICPCENFYE